MLALRTGTAELESAGSDEWLLAHFLEKGLFEMRIVEAISHLEIELVSDLFHGVMRNQL